MKPIKLYNTLSRSIEDFEPLNPPKVTIYHCGPTVYWTQHIGNMRAMYFGDIVRRVLKHLGYDVKYARNYTDVGHLDGDNAGDADTGEDRMEKGAKREGVTVWDIANKYINQFDSDIQKIGNLVPDFSPRATQEIEEQVEMVKTLIEKGFAYVTDEAVYFDVSKAKNYNQLNKQKIEENEAGAGHGTSENSQKRNSYDFALWFFRHGHNKNHSMHWDTKDSSGLARFYTEENPDGDGFPGWHIECSAMAKKYLGTTLDIHIGGVEHIPVHHTNEIAQSENANSEPFVKYWLHYEHLLIDAKKMSKSDGNVYFMDDIYAKGFTGLDLRYFFLNANYRSQQNFTWDGLRDAKVSREKIVTKYLELQKVAQAEKEMSMENNDSQKMLKESYEKEFNDFVSNDFNVTGALSVIWKILKDETVEDLTKYDLLTSWDDVLGIQMDKIDFKHLSTEIKSQVESLILERNTAKQNKEYSKADEIRDKLVAMGIEIQDSPTGTKWKLK